MKRPSVIGITGGIGSGKSTICRLFGLLGIPVYEADSRAKQLVNHSTALKAQIIALLGSDAYTDGSYNRAWVASQVFAQPALLQQLNAIIHPAVRQDATAWVQAQVNVPYVLYEAALLKAAGEGNSCDKVIAVLCPEAQRLKRVLARDHRSAEEIKRIMAQQMSDAQRMAFADFLIYNDDTHLVIPQVLALHTELCKEQ